MKIKLMLAFLVLVSTSFYAQNVVVIKGKVVEKQDNTIINIATVNVSDGSITTVVDENGVFVLELKQLLPVEVVVSAIGYKDYKYTVRSKEEKLTVYLEADITSLDEVVISASRTPERVFESPVSIERVGTAAIEATTSATFYDGLENLKGVDINTSSLTFKSINTRGFAAIGNTRFVQLVDGMDNSSPGLSFVLGNLIGLNELDVQSVELLPGASSALYGANAFNGIMFMRSKSPFTHQGTSVYGKTGFTNSENAGANGYIDVGMRVARRINDKVALKFTASLLSGTDWFASDTRNNNEAGKVLGGDRYSDTIEGKSYNGINIYGDENSRTINGERISRTGYDEEDLIDTNTNSFRASIAAHFKPLKEREDIEFIYSSKFGTGSAIYQGASRYALRNFIMHQHKLELQSKHLMIRSYATFEDAGDSYDIRSSGANTLAPSDEQWYSAYEDAINGKIKNISVGDTFGARNYADSEFRLVPETPNFKKTFDKVINDSNVSTGSKFVDSSRMFHSDINYNFKELIKFAEVQLGGSARRYVLDSEGTLFTDSKEENITYNEFGVYAQLQRSLLNKRLKLTGSLRYDKGQNFDGNFSPRFSVSYNVDQDEKHNIRASFQTGFRNPTTQDRYTGLDIGRTILIGSAPGNPEKYNKTFNLTSPTGIFAAGGSSVEFNGLQGYENSFTRTSLTSFLKSGGADVSLLKKANVNYVQPEQVKSYEIGYRGKLSKKTALDFSTYYNKYKDFIVLVTTVAPLYGNVDLSDVIPGTKTPLALVALANQDFTPTSLYTNTDVDVASYGFNIGLETKVFGDCNFGINYTFSKQDFDQSQDLNFETEFNTPEHKVKVSFANSNFYKGLGFGVNVRWQDTFNWQSAFVDDVIDARTILDAQFMYDIDKWNSKLKLGGANILGNQYQSAPGSGTVGSQIYTSYTYKF